MWLHFAEIAYLPKRVFSVLLEGDPRLEDYWPGRRGFATPDTQEFDVQVNDGVLDIDFVRTDDPKISAIEVAPLD